MATLRDAINIAKTEPNSERSKQLLEAIKSGKMDAIAVKEGLDLSKFKDKVGAKPTILGNVVGPIVSQALKPGTQATGEPTIEERLQQSVSQFTSPESMVGKAVSGTVGGVKMLTSAPEKIGEAITGYSGQNNQITKLSNPERVQKGVEGALDVGEGALGTIFSAPSAVVSEVPVVGDVAEYGFEKLSKGLQSAADKVKESMGIQPGSKDAELIDRSFQIGGNSLAAIFLGKAGEKVAPIVKPKVEAGIEAVKPVVGEAFEATKSMAGKGMDAVSKGTEKILSKIPSPQKAAEGIVSGVQKIDPSKTIKFTEMSGGLKPSQWLSERGIIGTRKNTIKQLIDRFQQSKKTVDEGLAKIQGTYYHKSFETALNDLKDYYIKTEDRQALSITKRRLEKLKNEGLTMSEENAVKRDYERNVKLNYGKDITVGNALKERAKNIDSQMREHQIAEAEKAGFGNLKEFNKETQLSKFLADEIGKKLLKQEANNTLGLTDYVILGGVGGLEGILATLVKKGVLSEWAQSRLAKLLAKKGKKSELPELPKKTIELKSKQKLNQM